MRGSRHTFASCALESVEQSTKFELVINLKSAKALRLPTRNNC